MQNKQGPIPIIDLFAGPGGLGEGFSSVLGKNNEPVFKINLSIEKDPVAHKTLTLRAFYRQFPKDRAPVEYYEYLRGNIERAELFAAFPKQAKEAREEARCMTLGKDDVSSRVGEKLKGRKDWVLIGGPPCQAYSLVGRSRMSGAGARKEGESKARYKQRAAAKQSQFQEDHRHLLYREYLRIIADHSPAVFVMENVKGILSAKLKGEKIFPQITSDLQFPNKALGRKVKSTGYTIHSFVAESDDLNGGALNNTDYLIRSEKYGIPQARHRVILLGIRNDLGVREIGKLQPKPQVSVGEAIGDLPPLTPGLTREKGLKPVDALLKLLEADWWLEFENNERTSQLAKFMRKQLIGSKGVRHRESRGGPFVEWHKHALFDWYKDKKLQGVCNHETRGHIREDLWRYFFCACFARKEGRAPHLRDFPEGLLPKHMNVEEAVNGSKFGDRFRVQLEDEPSTTVVSHISKDGHYYIHYDPRQYRSLTVREAARLQTFPDNYFFEGPRTQQYHQVGNAVPPLLAAKIAETVRGLLEGE
ncbi:MAG: DNA cytosine methyltransferase [Akkermansiaceae bacterium]|nr:DNA cytosine methyltransferase [Akkermansiaceae bacterium]